MAFTKIVSPGIDTTGSYTVQELNTVGVMTAGTVQVGAATTVHTTGIDLGSGNITSHNINSTGIITATSFVGPVTGNITGDITATSGTFSGNVSIGGTLTYEDVTNIDSVGVITARSDVSIADKIIHTGDTNTAIRFPAVDTFTIETGGNERLRVDSEGKTTIQGSGASNNPFEIFTLKNTETSAAGQSIQINLETNRNSQQGVSKIKSIASDNGGTAILELNSSQYRIKNQASTSTYATIDSSGLIGIGTVSPSGPIHAHVASGTQRSYLEASAAHSFLRLKSGSTSYNSGIEFFSGASNIANVNGLGAGGLQFEVNGSERLRITSAGNIGIGLTNPTSKLQVANGHINLSAGYSIQWSDSHERIEQSDGKLEFFTSNGEKMVLSGDNLGLGASNNTSYDAIAQNFLIANESSHAGMTIRSGGSGAFGAIHFADGVTDNTEKRAGRILYGHTGDFMTFYTANTERLRITSAGKLTVTPADTTSSYATTDGGIDIAQIISSTGTSSSQSIGIQFSLTKSGQTGAIAEIGAIREGSGLSGLVFRTRDNSTGRNERLRIRSNGDLILGPYDAPGSYTTPANNVPYSIKVAPYGWQHHSEIAAISMGNHSGSTGNDDGEIVFKTAKDAHSSTTGLVERLRIDSNGDAIFYGNPSIDATDLYYTNSYSTNGWSTSNWYTVVPHGLTSNSTYLVVLSWDWGGSHGQPYYLATQQLYSTVNGTNGNGSENELTPMCSTHTGSTGARIRCRVLAQNGGTPAMQVNMNYTMGSSSYLKVKVWKMTFLNRS